MILLDTTPLVALCDARDAKHALTVKQLDALAGEDLVTCEAVLTEACFHLPHRSQRLRLHALLDELDVQPVDIGQEDLFWLEVFAWLAKYADHEPDWADGCLVVLSGRHSTAKVWTYDREFKTTWRRPNGTVIPLAARLT